MTVLSDTQLELMRRRLADAGIDVAPTGATTADASPEPVPADGELGIAERRMWKIYELDPDSDAHNFSVLLRFGAPYTIETVVAAAERLIAASQVFGSVIEVDEDGTPRRRPAPRDGQWVTPGELWEWGSIPADAHGASLADDAAALAKVPFRLREEQPCRVRIQAHDDEVSMTLVLHHLAGDETILPPVLTALVADGSTAGAEVPTSGGTAVDSTPRTGAHADAAVRHAQSTWAAEGIRYPLSGALPDTTPEDSWLSVMGEGPGRLLSVPIDDDRVAALEAFAREVGATPNALFVVLSALTVSAQTGADDFVILVPADNRRPEETTDRVGYSGNIIPMRFTLDGQVSVADAVRQAVATVYEAMEYSSVDYGTILTALRQGGGRFPVAEIMTLVKNAPLRGVPIPAAAQVTCETIFKDIVHYPLSISFEFDEHDHVHLEIEYRTDILAEADAQRVAQIVESLVELAPQSSGKPLGELFTDVRGKAV
ncbi:condensation domain-containing protein [Jongsikchunia kroppenstedtii]|uniref:condensation domain-containing protein n=1 Tax=Jongsikchunia kroppenstedtii TaxID=1121721 RepID=UPI0003641790|nr:condensation domain-containing protein [Jongsikchunia kroppenstedtii]